MYTWLTKFYGPDARTFDIRKGHPFPKPVAIDEIEAASRNEAWEAAQLRGTRIQHAAHFTLENQGRVHARK
jgi:hypothetical protein